VVLAFALVFVLNTTMSALYTVVVPAVGNYR
jgi:phospholipid/cholesterol/gamma-HCH transport system permease protein